jgi:cell division protein ZapE
MTKPSSAYQSKVDHREIEEDLLQKNIIEKFDCLFDQVTKKKSWFNRSQHIFGIYLWGPVGRGKTMIMDLFLKSLPEKIITKRYHYHAFMRMIHKELKNIQGTKDPLTVIAKKLKKEMQLLFLDEFFVMDMANAMILGDLLKALFKEDFIILTTSNCEPDQLYPDGMFRERFLPAIEAIKSNMQVLSLTCDKDYRIRKALEKHRYIYPDDARSTKILNDIFKHITPGALISDQPIQCLDREIKIEARSNDAIWFDFNQICSIPRSQNDYLDLAEQYDLFIISHIPKFDTADENAGLYFTMLIDVLYDEHKQIIVSAQAPIDELFPQAGPLALGFERTYSRLIEMQSPDYIKRNNTPG